MTRRILHVVTNVGHYDDPAHPTGLWLSELAHAWEVFEERGFQQALVSPLGGASPLEPRSLVFPNYDRAARAWHRNPARMALLQDTLRPDQVDAADYDAVFFTGGHAVMYDFPASEGLQRITREMWEQDKIVSSVCHGYCGLLDTKLSDGSLLVGPAPDRLRLAGRGPGPRGPVRPLQRGGGDAPARGALREGEAPVRPPRRRRRPARHRTEPRIGQADGREARGAAVTVLGAARRR